MSVIALFENGRTFVTFREFVELNEAVSPRETSYGTDFENGEFQDHGDGWHHTFFSHKSDHHVMVILNHKTHEVGFGIHKGERSHDPADYSMDRTNTNHAFRVFSKVNHVILHGADKLGMKRIHFNGETDSLKSTYDAITHNKNFLGHLNSRGWKYSGKIDTSHVFEKGSSE